MSEEKLEQNNKPVKEPFIGVGFVSVEPGLLLSINSQVEEEKTGKHNIVLGLLTNGQKVKVLEEKGIWYKISCVKNAKDVLNAIVLQGYCKKAFIKIVKKGKKKNEESNQESNDNNQEA